MVSALRGTTRDQADPLGVVAFTCGVVGVVLCAGLWLIQLEPTLVGAGGLGYELLHGGQLRDQVVWLSGTLGAVAVGAGLLSTLGGRPRGLTGLSILLGLFALTYPAMSLLGIVAPPTS